MFIYPKLQSVALSFGFIKVYWYGIMYLFGLLGAWLLLILGFFKPFKTLTKEQTFNLIFLCGCGIILGGRLGYIFLYDFEYFIQKPCIVIKFWDGGMAFHGGLLGAVLSTALFYRKHQLNIANTLDFIAIAIPIGLGMGRLGNFINGELFGCITDASIGMVFPNAGPLPRYPSQLFECILEGFLLFFILYYVSKTILQRLFISVTFLLYYGAIRFFVEFFRQPDEQIDYLLFDWLTMGQLLCIPMFIFGCIGLLYLTVQRIGRKEV